MADPHGIRVGDTLRVDMEVIRIEEGRPLGDNGARVKAPGGTEHFIGFRTIKTAEHIPAPKPCFKHGDWVRHIGCRIRSDKGCPLGVGYVLAVKASDDYPDQIEAFFAGWSSNFSKKEGDAPGVVERYPADQLEHDEAPE